MKDVCHTFEMFFFSYVHCAKFRAPMIGRAAWGLHSKGMALCFLPGSLLGCRTWLVGFIVRICQRVAPFATRSLLHLFQPRSGNSRHSAPSIIDIAAWRSNATNKYEGILKANHDALKNKFLIRMSFLVRSFLREFIEFFQ